MRENINYKELLRDKRWIKKRNEILSRDNNTCQHCGNQDRIMHVHHKRYIKDKMPWEYDDTDLITLCEQCHENETESNSVMYLQYKELRDVFKSKGLSMSLLESILASLTNALCMNDEGENVSESRAYAFIKECAYGTQVISDIFALKTCGFNLRDFIVNCYPNFIDEYDNL